VCHVYSCLTGVSLSKGIRKLTPAVNFRMATDEAAKQEFLDSVCKQRIEAFRR
jgi:hypothetical protein